MNHYERHQSHRVHTTLKCVSHLQYVKSSPPSAAYMRQCIRSALVQIMASSIGTLGTNFCEILIKIQNFSFTKLQLKILSVKWWPFSLGGDELIFHSIHSIIKGLSSRPTIHLAWIELFTRAADRIQMGDYDETTAFPRTLLYLIT